MRPGLLLRKMSDVRSCRDVHEVDHAFEADIEDNSGPSVVPDADPARFVFVEGPASRSRRQILGAEGRVRDEAADVEEPSKFLGRDC